MKKKIAIIIERANIALGGAERSVFELAGALRGAGYDVDILAAKGQSNTGSIHILCPHQANKRASYAEFEKALEKHLGEHHYDIVHSVLPFRFADIYQPRGGSYAETIARNAASYQNKFIETYKRCMAFVNFGRTAMLRAERDLCRDPNGPIVAALSQYTADGFKKHYGIEDGRITVIPNGVRVDKPVNVEEAQRFREQLLAKLCIKQANEPILLLFAANNFRLKGLAPLIKALKLSLVDYKVDNVYLIVAGHGKSLSYRFLARTSGVQKKVLFLGALRHIQDALAICDAAILPTFYDPSSRFILEALAAGKPVITTRYNGASELFVHDRHGKIIDCPTDIKALAEALCYFSKKTNIQKAADAIVADNLKERVSISRVVERLTQLYESLPAKGKNK